MNIQNNTKFLISLLHICGGKLFGIVFFLNITLYISTLNGSTILKNFESTKKIVLLIFKN